MFTFNNIKHVFTFSDIHGDLDALVLCLRNCAEVIVQEQGMNYNNEKVKNCQLKSYRDDLGFIWTASDTMIVIVGDIIDNVRVMNGIKTKRDTELDHEEIKILRFLRALDAQAQKHNSNIITLIGNHDDMNITDTHAQTHWNYISEKSLGTHYFNISRTQYFSAVTYQEVKKNNLLHGIDLYRNHATDGKLAVIVKINDFIFVHGGISKAVTDYLVEHINKGRTTIEEIINTININYNKFIMSLGGDKREFYSSVLDNGTGMLWYRKHDARVSSQTMCESLVNNITQLCGIDDHAKECAANTMLVIGHCPQNFLTQGNMFAKTFSQVTPSTNKHIISGPIYDGRPMIYKAESEKVIVFGITVDCQMSRGSQSYRLYRVDTAMARCFDWPVGRIEYVDGRITATVPGNIGPVEESLKTALTRDYLSKCPQVLYINQLDAHKYDTKIHRAKLADVLLNQYRPQLGYKGTVFPEIIRVAKEIDNKVI
jgi:hypothetical protein